MPWYEGMGLFENIMENITDLVPRSINNAISDTVIDMDADGNQRKASDYQDALSRGENLPPPAGMPEEIVDESRAAAIMAEDEGFDLPMDNDIERELALADGVKPSSGSVKGT